MHIFSFLSVPDLCISVAPVCTTWRNLSKSPTLWTHLVFQEETEGEQVRILLERSPLLLSLKLKGRKDCWDLLLQVSTSCTKLKELTLNHCCLSKSGFELLMENCPDICYLDLDLSYVYGIDFYDVIRGFHHLQHLSLCYCGFLDGSGLAIIAKHCQLLEYLNIEGNPHIYDDAVVCMTKELSHCLKNLFLDGSNLTDTAYQSLQACKKLQKLGVSSCEQMTDISLTGFSGLKYLTFLKLHCGTKLTPGGFLSLFCPESLPFLTHLDLELCSLVDDNVLKALSCSCPRLVHLVLQWCREVTDAGISAIIAACPRLRVLDLAGVVQLTGVAFIDLPSSLPDLLILDLEHCSRVDSMILQCIVAQKPSVRVLNYWGKQVIPPGPDGSDENKERRNCLQGKWTTPRLPVWIMRYY
ncbi:F-box and leucine-rich repeat protein 13-like [Panulirus ornatus]|uniref:F-box and leucine-rich repeat protein 13-like n=1 Tax=Panulirus ornatus TaxID=150431 RepID=UPI003A8C4A2B